MKIIHTADWHLGRMLNGKSLLKDQAYILEQFVTAMKEEQPDVIVLAGDVYDTSYPSKEAIQLLERTIDTLNLSLNISLIIISGNHDGKERLNYGARWFEKSDIYIRTQLNDMTSPITIKGVNFYTLPFATISEVQQFFQQDKIETHQQAIDLCMKHMSQHMNHYARNLLIGHMTVQGGKRSDSERPLTIGTVESVDRKSFEDFKHVMLGHLHHPFSIDSDYISYSGSLLQYSFSEVSQPKGYRRVIVENENIKDTFVPLEPKRVLEIVEGNYEDAIQEKLNIKSKDNYLHFKLKNMSHVTDPMMHLKQIYPNTLALTNISFEFENAYLEKYEAIEQLDDKTIINNFYEDITSTELTATQKSKITTILNTLTEESDK